MSIKTIASAALAALAMPLLAVEPVAVWDGDFTATTKGTFTLSENGNTKTDSYLQISGDNGITVTSTDALNVFTVIMRCSGLNLAAENAQVLFTSYVSDSQANLTGYYLLSGNSNTKGIWEGADWSSESGATKNPVPANYTTLIYNHQQTNGTYGYALGPTSSEDETVVRTTLYSVVGLRSSGLTYKGFAVGGLRGTTSATLLPATGLKITSLAVFSGTLSEAEMKGYLFPSEIQAINISADTTVSAINAQYDSTTYKAAKVTVASGVTITVDEAFSTALPIAVSSAGSITLSAESQPDASYFTGVDFSGVQGAVLRSWLTTPGVVGFNFNSANGTDTSAALVAGTWKANASDASGTADLFDDGLSTLTWSSATLYQRSTTSTMLDGYLDDGANGGNGATITLSCVPYETYDVVIYASTDNGSAFTAKTVNGTTYTWDSATGAVVAGNAAWGKAALSTPVYGVNALRIKNLSGPLTIYGLAKDGNSRGGIAAIEIMPPETPDNILTYTLTLSGTETTWSGGTWTLNGQTVAAPASGYVEIVASASTALTVDKAVSLADLKVRGGDNIVVSVSTNNTGSLYAIRATVESGVFQQGSPAVLGATPSIVVASGATFDLNAFAMNAATAVYVEGAGAGNWPWALTSSGGAFAGTIQNMYLTGDATVGGEYKIVLGADWAGSYCYLQNHTLVKTGTGELLVRNWNIPDDGTVIVRGGELHTDQWNCLNKNTSGTVTLKVEADGTVRGTNQPSNPPAATTLDWEGTLNTASRTFIVKSALSGGGTTANLSFEANATANLKRDLTITSSLTLSGNASFLKDAEATADVTVSPAALAASGAITVGAGVVFNLGTARPAASFTVDDEGTLVVQKSSATDVPVVKVSARPENVVFKDETGAEIASPRLVYDSGAGTLTFYSGNVWTAANDTAFDTVANWSSDATPAEGENATVSISGDTAITVAGTYTLNALTVTGAGEVTFTGAGAVTAANIYLENGATLKRDGATISATTGISLDSGTVLRLDGVTESAAISGAGAVETYGTVVLAHANTMTGGITVKPGSALSTTAKGGYGEYQSGWAYSAQRQVVVEDGGTVDINNIANNDGAVALTIAGKGILQNGVYSGAVTYSGATAITSGSRQISSLVLTGDAMVDLGVGWGLVHSNWGNARLGLNGHTLTVRGTGTFPIANANTASGATTTGTLVLDGATLELSNAASNLAGVNVVAKGCATINVAMAPSALGSLTLKPSATGTTASNWNLPSGFVPSLDTSNVDPTGLTAEQVLTLFTAPQATTLTGETISVKAGGRYTTTISGNTVTATVGDALSNPFLHYDFEEGAAVDTGKASDSRTQITSFGENSDPKFVSGRNNCQAVRIRTPGCTPYWDTNVSGVSPFVAGEVTVTTVAKLKETGIVLWGLGNTSDSNPAMGLVATSTSVSVVTRNTSRTVETILTLDGTSDLTKGWHFIAVVANAKGTTLYVDNLSATTDKTVSFEIGQQGQLGSFHGGAIGGSKVGADGYYLDDWCVYDATLTAKELRAIKAKICPYPFLIRVR